MWKSYEDPDHRYCCEPIDRPGARGVRGSYCRRHAVVAARPEDGAVLRPEPVRAVQPVEPSKRRRREDQAPAERVKPGRKSSIDADRLLALRSEGLSLAALSEALGVNKATVQRALTKAGVATGRWVQRAAAPVVRRSAGEVAAVLSEQMRQRWADPAARAVLSERISEAQRRRHARRRGEDAPA